MLFSNSYFTDVHWIYGFVSQPWWPSSSMWSSGLAVSNGPITSSSTHSTAKLPIAKIASRDIDVENTKHEDRSDFP